MNLSLNDSAPITGRILIMDDDDNICLSLEKMLKHIGLETISTKDVSIDEIN